MKNKVLSFTTHLLPLQQENTKLAYGVGKELAMIDLNHTFEKETVDKTIDRLTSLITHITRSFSVGSSTNIITWIEKYIQALQYIQSLTEK